MRNFQSNSRGKFNSPSRRPEGRGGFRDRNSGGFERGRPEMHEVTCSKCKRQCEVPFRPTGDKPVFCSDCFRKGEDSGSSSRSNFDSRNRNFNPRSNFSPRNSFDSRDKNTTSQSGISSDQFKQINTKLDKIIAFLNKIELEEESDEDNEEEDEEDSDEN
ncbi:MAG: hypothetical protein Q7S06_00015 [Nanoarchaeota archaeon]|nr:hypothetical protein [Nanoarchaeota archaeon]